MSDWKRDEQFNAIIGILLKHEGGYATYDGGTYKGVTKKWFPRWQGWEIIDRDRFNLEANVELQELVKEFYYEHFYTKLKLNKVSSTKKSLLMLEAGVLSGKPNSVKIAQIISGSVVDKVIGKNTLRNINDMDDKIFCHHFILEMVEYFHYISRKKRTFFYGWTSRWIDLYHKVSNDTL